MRPLLSSSLLPQLWRLNACGSDVFWQSLPRWIPCRVHGYDRVLETTIAIMSFAPPVVPLLLLQNSVRIQGNTTPSVRSTRSARSAGTCTIPHCTINRPTITPRASQDTVRSARLLASYNQAPNSNSVTLKDRQDVQQNSKNNCPAKGKVRSCSHHLA